MIAWYLAATGFRRHICHVVMMMVAMGLGSHYAAMLADLSGRVNEKAYSTQGTQIIEEQSYSIYPRTLRPDKINLIATTRSFGESLNIKSAPGISGE